MKCLWMTAMVALATSAAAGPTCSRVVVGSVPNVTGSDYSAREILDLTFSVGFPPARKFTVPETIEMRFFSPNGHLYQAVTVPVAADGSSERERRLEKHPFPIKVSRPRTDKGQPGLRWVDVPPLPVGGTSIATASLYGTWRVEAWPQGADSACQARFHIVR
jgi:hypothetical protein